MTRTKEMRIPRGTEDAHLHKGDSIIAVDSYPWEFEPIRPSVRVMQEDARRHMIRTTRLRIALAYLGLAIIGASFGMLLAFWAGYCG